MLNSLFFVSFFLLLLANIKSKGRFEWLYPEDIADDEEFGANIYYVYFLFCILVSNISLIWENRFKNMQYKIVRKYLFFFFNILHFVYGVSIFFLSIFIITVIFSSIMVHSWEFYLVLLISIFGLFTAFFFILKNPIIFDD